MGDKGFRPGAVDGENSNREAVWGQASRSVPLPTTPQASKTAAARLGPPPLRTTWELPAPLRCNYEPLVMDHSQLASSAHPMEVALRVFTWPS